MSAKKRLHLTSLTTLFKDSDVPTKIDRTLTGTRGQFWPDTFLATTNDSYGTSGSQTQVFCYVQLTQTNCWYHGPARPALELRSFGSSGPTAWNDMPAHLRNLDLSLSDFRQLLKTALFQTVPV